MGVSRRVSLVATRLVGTSLTMEDRRMGTVRGRYESGMRCYRVTAYVRTVTALTFPAASVAVTR